MVLTDGPACKIDCFPLLNSKYSQLTKTKAHNQKTEFEFAVKDNFSQKTLHQLYCDA